MAREAWQQEVRNHILKGHRSLIEDSAARGSRKLGQGAEGSHLLRAQSRESKLEAERGNKLSKPDLSDVLPPASPRIALSTGDRVFIYMSP